MPLYSRPAMAHMVDRTCGDETNDPNDCSVANGSPPLDQSATAAGAVFGVSSEQLQKALKFDDHCVITPTVRFEQYYPIRINFR